MRIKNNQLYGNALSKIIELDQVWTKESCPAIMPRVIASCIRLPGKGFQHGYSMIATELMFKSTYKGRYSHH